MAYISLSGVTKRYGGTTAVDHIDLECHRGEFLVILGPAGAGKTSILKMIAGIEEITEGEIFIGGARINHLPPHEVGASMVFETYALYPHMTVFENLSFPLKTTRLNLSASAIERKVMETAGLLGIRNLLERNPSELSGGQKQRVSLGRCLIKKPKVYLMDEPISHLDAKLRHEMRRELKKIKSGLDASVIYVTHDYMESLSLADRIAVLNKGKIVQIGDPAELYERPENTFVASLVGYPRINLIRGSAGSSGKGFFFNTSDNAITIPIAECVKRSLEHQKSNTLFAGIRPNAIGISPNPAERSVNKGFIVMSEILGYRNIHHVKTGDTIVTVLLSKKGNFEKNQPVSIQIMPDRVLFFDASGKLIPAEDKNHDGY